MCATRSIDIRYNSCRPVDFTVAFVRFRLIALLRTGVAPVAAISTLQLELISWLIAAFYGENLQFCDGVARVFTDARTSATQGLGHIGFTAHIRTRLCYLVTRRTRPKSPPSCASNACLQTQDPLLDGQQDPSSVHGINGPERRSANRHQAPEKAQLGRLPAGYPSQPQPARSRYCCV